MQIDNWLCKFGKLKSGALTKNKGVLQFLAGNGVPPRWGGMSIRRRWAINRSLRRRILELFHLDLP